MQESEVSLGRACTALTELDGAKTELWRCVAAGDTALLEGQLQLLHQQWEELCTKVRERERGRGGEGERERGRERYRERAVQL